MEKLISKVMELLNCNKNEAIQAIDTTFNNHSIARKGVLLSIKKEFDIR